MTNHYRELAILGGPPTFPEPLHVGRPNIGDAARFRERMDGILARRWLTNDGPLVQTLEKRIAERTGVRHCVATANATLALQLLVRALGLQGEVIVPSFTFIATASALSWEGLEPVFCDIDPSSHCIDPRRAEELVTSSTAAILAVHLWGRICDTDALAALAGRHDIPLLIDAAHAFGSSAGGRQAGSFGTAELLSFHATKILNAFEGGAIVTDDDGLAETLRNLRNFGFTGLDTVSAIGINAKMSEASAAMGLTSLESLDDFIACNRRNYQCYLEGLAHLPGLSFLPEIADGDTWNHHYVVVEIDEAACGLSRDMLLDVLHAEGVLARRYFYPGCHRALPYAARKGRATSLNVTERVAGRVLQLPTGTAVVAQDVIEIARILTRSVENASRIRKALASRPASSYRSTHVPEAPADA